uniref:Beta-glucuronidase n=1 Tax=Acrobeloides nanus TaxID=290746 RepID=A0A914EGH7_9BILA
MRCLLVLSLFLYTYALYPQRNEIRQYDSLDGLWTFVREQSNTNGTGLVNQWYLSDLSTFPNATQIPVPSAYNDLVEQREWRDHVGWVWYQLKYTPAQRDQGLRTFLRFESVNYFAMVFLNDKNVGNHTGGHLPFEFEVTFDYTKINFITVAVNNTLSNSTIPPGEFQYKTEVYTINGQPYSVYPDGFFEQTPDFDFFNYAGILRSAYVLKLGSVFISDVWIIAQANGSLSYTITLDKSTTGLTANVTVSSLQPTTGTIVYSGTGLQNSAIVQNIELWYPRGYGYPSLYVMEAKLLNGTQVIDIYRETFGFRTVTWDSDKIYINGKPFYCHGFGAHEDFELHGRGYNPVVMIKDLNTMEWMNGNCYRTSHYPYSQERAYEADRRGIAVITETPAVGMRLFDNTNLALHKYMLTEMIQRDKNHPSVIAWSMSNEPQTYKNESKAYYQQLANVSRTLDSTRPVTNVLDTNWDDDQIAEWLDIICINRYYGWYSNTGYLQTIANSYIGNFLAWKQKFNKPMILTEYGAGAIAGLTREPGVDFTEEYQVEVIRRVHMALDELRKNGTITGEMIWNFADFMTSQSTTRAAGNHKGVLTRNRQPKMAAYVIKDRYYNLTVELANATSATSTSRQRYGH